MVNESTFEDMLALFSKSYSTEDISLFRETVPNSFPTINGKCMLAIPPAWTANLLKCRFFSTWSAHEC